MRSPVALLALSVYIGFTGGAYYLGAESYMLGTVPARFLGTAAALLSGIQTLGGALGGLIAAPIIDSRGFGFFGILAAGGSLLVLIAGLLFMPSARPAAAGS